ncbi:LytR/AlgR family response regulator transcription factor [Pollutibacter soli]|uniref:LytR/AlgR family response regulator transcription factor n=1 Tax=Pollutibacter soli TaxID=3034157 RepID=UPI003013D364
MESPVKILIVEDEMIIAAKISMQLTGLGYEVTGILPRGEEALVHIAENKPDIVLLDIQLKGKMDGIETASQIRQKYNIAVIYLTANADDATFNRAKSTRPAAFITKPFKQLDLQRAIELAISHMAEEQMKQETVSTPGDEQPYILKDRIFIRNKDRMIKIMTSDILYLEADRNYSRIFTRQKEYVLSITLKIIEEKLSPQYFLRIHRSYLVNILHVDEIAENYLTVNQVQLPFGAGTKEQLMQRMQTL